jgi:hypothetical protein
MAAVVAVGVAAMILRHWHDGAARRKFGKVIKRNVRIWNNNNYMSKW